MSTSPTFSNTVYEIYDAHILLRVGERSEELDALLAQHGDETWSFITPYNPYPKVLTDEENTERLKELGKMLDDYTTYSGEWRGDETHPCPAEKGYFILWITAEEAKYIGNYFGQKAIITGKRGGAVELVNLR